MTVPEDQKINSYYTQLFTEDPFWSTGYPNPDEAARWGKIVVFVSEIVHQRKTDTPIRILDLGCGRGWLTNLLSVFGEVMGVDPVENVIIEGQKLYPHLSLSAGTAQDVLLAPDFSPFDLVVSSEVIEHIPNDDKNEFLRAIYQLLKPGGSLVLTTPRGKFFDVVQKHASSKGSDMQPVEEWVTEKELAKLFVSAGFNVQEYTRAAPFPRGGKIIWRLWRSNKFKSILGVFGLKSLRMAMAYSVSKYQIWWVKKSE